MWSPYLLCCILDTLARTLYLRVQLSFITDPKASVEGYKPINIQDHHSFALRNLLLYAYSVSQTKRILFQTLFLCCQKFCA